MAATFKEKIYGLEYDAEPLSSEPGPDGKSEMDYLLESWQVIRMAFNQEGKPFVFLDDIDFMFYKAAVQIMKAYYKGMRYTGLDPDEGEFGVRLPQVEDLCGQNDLEWGSCIDDPTTGTGSAASVTDGSGTWLAGQMAWLFQGTTTSGAGNDQSVTQNGETYADQTSMHLMNTTGSQKWAFLFFGIRSYSTTPVVKDVLIYAGGCQLAVQQVEHQLRGTGMRMAKFDGAIFCDPERSFRVGVTVRTVAQDKITPLGVIILTGRRAKDTTIDRPVAA